MASDQLYIDRGFVPAETSSTIDVVDPAIGAAIGTVPWGSYKQSGIGRELGTWGVEEYLNVKQVYINLSQQPIGWY